MIRKANNAAIVFALLILMVLLLAACKKETPPQATPSPAPATKPKPVQKQMTSATVAGIPDQTLNFTTKKDPFKPFAEPVPQGKPATVARGSVRTEDQLPIQSFDVNKFRVSGIIAGVRENTALVLDPGGKGYIVKPGMLIGNSDGRISRIGPSFIEVVEPYRDDNGRNRQRTIVLALPKKK